MSRSRKGLTEGEKVFLTYGTAFTLGAIILVIGLALVGWNFTSWLELAPVQALLLFSAAIIRAVAGFGLIATYIAVFEILLSFVTGAYHARTTAKIMKGVKSQDLSRRERITGAVKGVKIPDTFKREKISQAVKGETISEVLTGQKGRRARIAGLVFFLILVPIFILAYVTYRFLTVLQSGASTTVFDLAYLLVGVWGLLLSVYLFPIARGDFISFEKLSDLKDKVRDVEIKKGLNSIKHKVATFYSSKIKYQEQVEDTKTVDAIAEEVAAEHAKDYAENMDKKGFVSVRETVLAYRHKLTDYLLLPVVLGSLIVPPVAFLFLVVFGRAFFFKKDVGKSILERVIVIGAVVMAGAWATVDIYFGLTQGISVLVSFDYRIGAFIGVIVFIYLARKAV
jgi:hypothetical protein